MVHLSMQFLIQPLTGLAWEHDRPQSSRLPRGLGLRGEYFTPRAGQPGSQSGLSCSPIGQVLAMGTMTSAERVESHLAPRTPLDPMASKIHTNIYSVPAWGLGHWGGGLWALTTSSQRRDSDGRCSDARALGAGSVPGGQGVPVG